MTESAYTQNSVSYSLQKIQGGSFASVHSFAMIGVTGLPVQVECMSFRSLPGFHIVGLPNASVREAKERVLAALEASGVRLPSRKYILNLSPAWLQKEGCGYDLPIALSLLVAAGFISNQRVKKLFALGELSLDGRLLGVRSAPLLESLIDRHEFDGAIVAMEDSIYLREQDLVRGGGFSSLQDLICHLQSDLMVGSRLPYKHLEAQQSHPRTALLDLVLRSRKSELILAASASGGHHLLLSGPAGSGKTLTANALWEAIPPPDAETMAEIRPIYASAGLAIASERPFRSPHHSITARGMVGGGARCAPGEISLAHRGILFLDELLEFPRAVLEQLRVPLERRTVSLARGDLQVDLPAAFHLVAATNLCPCGRHGSKLLHCRCGVAEKRKYRSRLSEALLDRFDLQVLLQDREEEEKRRRWEPAAFQHQVRETRARMLERQGFLNVDLSGEEPFQVWPWTEGARLILEEGVRSRISSRRSKVGLARVALTICDWEGGERVEESHAQEALSLRLPMPD